MSRHLHDFRVVAAAQRDGQRARAVARQRAAGLVHVDARAGDALRALPQAIGDLAGAFVALVPEVERHDDDAGVHVGAAAEAAGAHDHALRIAALHFVHRDFLDLAQLPVEVRDARAFRRGDEDAHEGAVFLRRELARKLRSPENGKPNTNSSSTTPNSASAPPTIHSGRLPVERAAQTRGIAVVEIVEHAIDAARHARLRHAVGEQLRRHHRRERQRDERRETHGRGHGHAELAEQTARCRRS